MTRDRDALIWSLRAREERRGRVTVVTVEGRLGAPTAAALRDVLDAALGARPERCVVDLAGVDYLSSAGLAVLTEAHRRAAIVGCALVLCSLSPSVRAGLDLSGAAAGLPIAPDRHAAGAPPGGAAGVRPQ